MPRREVTILNHQGMHARPAMQLVEIASRYGCKVRMVKGDLHVDAKSIMEVMTLEAVQGTVLALEADGEDADKVLEAIAELVANKFYED